MGTSNTTISITPSQNRLLDYWLQHQLPCGCAPRQAINPGHVRDLLANISIVELSPSGHAKFRLAGSKLRDIVGAEARGRSVSEIQGGDLEPWCDALLSVLDTRLPVAGITERPDGQRHIWLRLPLLDHRGNLSQIMCHDQLVKDGVPPLVYRAMSDLIPQQSGRVAA